MRFGFIDSPPMNGPADKLDRQSSKPKTGQAVAVIVWMGLALGSTGLAQNGPAAAAPAAPAGGSSGNSRSKANLSQPVLVTGRVLMENGEDLPERVMIERSCQVTSGARQEGYTDADGYFSLQLGLTRGYVPDASTGQFDNGKASSPPAGRFSELPEEVELWQCELRARLPGYFSSTIPLTGRRRFNDPYAGTLMLRRGGKVDGMTISATSGLAPRESRNEFASGIKDLAKNSSEDAEKHFLKAVELYDRHAEAWYRLGTIYQNSDRTEEARKAYEKARDADSRYIYTYRGLLELAFERDDWKELDKFSKRMIELNPYEFPIAYYYNAVANLELRKLELAEERVRQAMEMDTNIRIPKTHYVLGWVQTRQGQYREARETFRRFLDLTTENGDTEASTRDALDRIEAALRPQASPFTIQPAGMTNAPQFPVEPKDETPKRPTLIKRSSED